MQSELTPLDGEKAIATFTDKLVATFRASPSSFPSPSATPPA
jgi:hypothetical protein